MAKKFSIQTSTSIQVPGYILLVYLMDLKAK